MPARLTSGERRDVRSGPRQALCRADDGLSRPRHAKPRDRGGEQRRPPAAALQQARHPGHRHRTRPCLRRPRDEGPRHPDIDRIASAATWRDAWRPTASTPISWWRTTRCSVCRTSTISWPASPCSSTAKAWPRSRSPPTSCLTPRHGRAALRGKRLAHLRRRAAQDAARLAAGIRLPPGLGMATRALGCLDAGDGASTCSLTRAFTDWGAALSSAFP